MYAAGIPVGFITDRKSPRLSAIIGMFALLGGYYPIKLGEFQHIIARLCADVYQHTMEAPAT